MYRCIVVVTRSLPATPAPRSDGGNLGDERKKNPRRDYGI
jgi:hypothetical protein